MGITIFHKGKSYKVASPKQYHDTIDRLESEMDSLNRQLITKNWQKLSTTPTEPLPNYGKGFY